MDNRSHDETSWDFELLGPELMDLQNLGFGNLELTGFDEKEIADFLAGAASPGQEGLTPDDEVPALREAAVAQPGELWRLGDHRLLCGDAMILADVKRVLSGARADLVIIDPPYNVDYEGATKEKLKIKNDRMADSLFFSFLLKAYENLAGVTKEGAGIYVFHADTEGVNFRRALVEAGWKLAQCCVWVKQTLVMGRQDYHWQHEPILYGWKPGASHRWFTDRKQTTVWNFDKPARSTEHPTMKPVDLIAYQILNSSRNGDVVLDTFGGAGSTLIACAKHGREARLLEIDPKYCDVIIRRWQEWSGEKALRTLSAARTRVDGGEAGSTMTFTNTDTAALDACCRRAMDCENAAMQSYQDALAATIADVTDEELDRMVLSLESGQAGLQDAGTRRAAGHGIG